MYNNDIKKKCKDCEDKLLPRFLQPRQYAKKLMSNTGTPINGIK